MRKKNIKFNCVRCNKSVYKITRKTDEKNKLCPNCRGKKAKFGRRGTKHLKNRVEIPLIQPQVETFSESKGKIRDNTEKPVLEALNQQNPDNTLQIVGEICKYFNILSRVIEKVTKLQPGHTETFLGLYLESKKELGI